MSIELTRRWTFDVRRSMFNDKQTSNDLTAEEIRTMLTVPAVEAVDLEIGKIEPIAAKYPNTAAALRAFALQRCLCQAPMFQAFDTNASTLFRHLKRMRVAS